MSIEQLTITHRDPDEKEAARRTERVETQDEARSSEARLRAVVDELGAGVDVKGLEGRDQRVHARAAGTAPLEDMLRRTYRELLAPEVAESPRATERQAPRSGDRLDPEREREELLRHLARVERLDAVARLASGIAHDFNNLLSVIQNAASVAASREGDGSFPRDEIEEIRDAAVRAAELTRRLMLSARREGPATAQIDLREPIAEIARTLRMMLGDRFDVRVQADDGLWPVLGDRALVEQSLLNLASNARDAMPEGGVVRISARNVELAERSCANLPAGRYVRLSVSDTGHGMTPDVASRALEPFFTTKGQGKGTGLGLATVWGTATMAGGTVEVDSACGEGSTIKIFLASEETGGAGG